MPLSPPSPVLTTSASPLTRPPLCARQHSVVFSITYGGRTVSLCVACALVDFLVKFLFFIPRFILVLASFGVPLLLLPVGSLIDLTSPPMLLVQAVALIWYTCYLPGLHALQAKRDSFTRKKRMLQAVEARRTRGSGSDVPAGDSRKIRADATCTGEDETAARKATKQSVGESILCLRRLASEKVTSGSRMLQNSLTSAKDGILRSCWGFVLFTRNTAVSTVKVTTSTVTATVATVTVTARRAVIVSVTSAGTAVIFCARFSVAGVFLAVRSLVSIPLVLISRMRPEVSADSAVTEGSDTAATGEKARKRGNKGRKGSRSIRGVGGQTGALPHGECAAAEEREEERAEEKEECGGVEQKVQELEIQDSPEISKVSEDSVLVEGLIVSKEVSEKEISRKRAVRKQRRARRERATLDLSPGDSASDAEATHVQADVERKRQNALVNVPVNLPVNIPGEKQLTRLTPPQLSQLIDQLMKVAAGEGCDSNESDCNESRIIHPIPISTHHAKSFSDVSSDNSTACDWEGSSSSNESTDLSRSSSNCCKTVRSGSGTSNSSIGNSSIGKGISRKCVAPAVSITTPTRPPTRPSPPSPAVSSTLSPPRPYPFATSSLPSLSASSSSFSLPSPVSYANTPQQWQQQQQFPPPSHHQHYHQQQQQPAAAMGTGQWEMWGSPQLSVHDLLGSQEKSLPSGNPCWSPEDKGFSAIGGRNTTSSSSNPCWSPEDKPWLPSPSPLTASHKAPGMPAKLPQHGLYPNAFSSTTGAGFDWLEMDAGVTLPPPAVPVTSALTACPGAADFVWGASSSSSTRRLHGNDTSYSNLGVTSEDALRGGCGGVDSVLGSGFADGVALEDVMYTREAIEEWVQ